MYALLQPDTLETFRTHNQGAKMLLNQALSLVSFLAKLDCQPLKCLENIKYIEEVAILIDKDSATNITL